MTPAGTCRSTSASRAARRATASASLCGLGPINEARTCSAIVRSIGSPSAHSSAHSSSAVDSQRAVATAIGRSASAACCCPATVRAIAAHRATRSGLSDQPSLTHSGRRCPSGATGSLASPSPMPNRSSGPAAGIVSASPCSEAQAQPGSARQPPNSSRCAALISQHVASRTPSATRRAAVWPDHSTQRGRNASSARPTAVARPGPATGQLRSAVARPRPGAGEMTSPTRSPRFTPAWRNDVTRSASATDPTLPRTSRHRRERAASCQGRSSVLAVRPGISSRRHGH